MFCLLGDIVPVAGRTSAHPEARVGKGNGQVVQPTFEVIDNRRTKEIRNGSRIDAILPNNRVVQRPTYGTISCTLLYHHLILIIYR